MTSSPPTISQDAQQALATIQADAIKAFYPVIKQALQNVIVNGSVSNDTVQALALGPALEAALPTLEQNVSQDLAAQIQTDLAAFVANLTPTT